MGNPNMGKELVSTPKKSPDDIQHWGVKGMKWGRRKGRTTSSGPTFRTKNGLLARRFKKTENPIVIKERERRQKFIKEYHNRDKMSVQAIKKRTDRLNAEYAFKQALEKPIVDKKKAEAEKRARRVKTVAKVAGGVAIGALVYSGIRAKQLSGSTPSLSQFNLKKQDGNIMGKRSDYNNYIKALQKHNKAKANVKMINDAARVVGSVVANKVLKNSGLENEDVLQHHGIKGMKWGQRKNRNTGSSAVISNPKTGGILRKFRKKDTTTSGVQLSKSDKRKKLIKRVAIAAGTAAIVAGTAYAVNKYAKTKGTNSYKLSTDKKNYKLKQPLSHKLIKAGLAYRSPYTGNIVKNDPLNGVSYKTVNGRNTVSYKPPYSTIADSINPHTFTGAQPGYKYKGKVSGKNTYGSYIKRKKK